jgi:hypothetical protein
METFKIGDWAEWTSQAQGSVKTKRGECIAVVPPRVRPFSLKPKLGTVFTFQAMDSCGLPRDYESYLFALPMAPKGRSRKAYWPRVSALKKI